MGIKKKIIFFYYFQCKRMAAILPGLLAVGEELLTAAGSYLLPKLGEAAVSYIIDKTAAPSQPREYQAKVGTQAKPLTNQQEIAVSTVPRAPAQVPVTDVAQQPPVQLQSYARPVQPIVYDYSFGPTSGRPRTQRAPKVPRARRMKYEEDDEEDEIDKLEEELKKLKAMRKKELMRERNMMRRALQPKIEDDWRMQLVG